MTAQPRISPFEVPSLPPLSALRDRAEEAAERSMRLREDGYVAGYQAGLDAAAEDVAREISEHRTAAARLTTAASALEAAVRDLAARDALALDELTDEAFRVGVELAVELVGRELRAMDEPVREAIGRALTLLPERGTPVVRVHPADLATATEAVEAELLVWHGDASVVPDHGVERGGCVVEVGDCRIDAQLSSAIDRLRAVLRS